LPQFFCGFFDLDFKYVEIPNLYLGSWSEWSRREGKEIAIEI
jgi:thiosulfate/3-mercaptopyruvate sulfurtransferase